MLNSRNVLIILLCLVVSACTGLQTSGISSVDGPQSAALAVDPNATAVPADPAEPNARKVHDLGDFFRGPADAGLALSYVGDRTAPSGLRLHVLDADGQYTVVVGDEHASAVVAWWYSEGAASYEPTSPRCEAHPSGVVEACRPWGTNFYRDYSTIYVLTASGPVAAMDVLFEQQTAVQHDRSVDDLRDARRLLEHDNCLYASIAGAISGEACDFLERLEEGGFLPRRPPPADAMII